ncbi:MAG TPA: SulP family inorganic anion transporter [Terriglobales bacterium]|jgi:SulP family sulfate permease|nr:SulP family inorganic anion transporter [Terriglobales bacterium]
MLPQISEILPELNLPGVHDLRQAVTNRIWQKLPRRASLRADAIAGLNGAINNVPDGMANSILTGVNPFYGLYANLMGPLLGGTFSSAQMMMITTTAAASLTAGQALASVPAGARASALTLMVILVGAMQVLFGWFGLGRLTRFVSYSVTTGLLAGISVLLILSQLPNMTGYAVTGANRIAQTVHLIANLHDINLLSLLIGAITLLLAAALPRTRIGNFGRPLAIVASSIFVLLFKLDVRTVEDLGDISGGLPIPVMPSLAPTFNLFTGALSVSVVVLVQSLGVSQSVPNPDGSPTNISRDFIAQGAANLASGFFRGLPVGGSLSATALNVISGAATRWSTILAGVWLGLFLVALPRLISYIAMPALGALLILAGLGSLKPAEVRSVWDAGWTSRLAGGTTFVGTLFLPIQAAVALGVVLSAILYVNRSSTDVAVVELSERPDGRIEERPPSEHLPSKRATVLDVYGHLFYAGARTLEKLLPDPRGADRPVVILRLRGRTVLGATLIDVLSNYARDLHGAKGRLYLTGLSESVHQEVVHSGKLQLSGPVHAYSASPVIGESTRRALGHATAWVANFDSSADSGPA